MIRAKTKVKENGKNGLEKGKRRPTNEVDHWAFLEEIEAPMWVDLTLEPLLNVEHIDDPWFHKSHVFHQCSARQLRSKFSHLAGGDDFFNFNMQGVFSPKLPSSVSKSRGKDYQIRNPNGQVSISKGHPINDMGGRILSLDVGINQENHNGASCSSSSLQNDNSWSTTITCTSQVRTIDLDTGGVLNSHLICTSEGVSTSTITAEYSSQQQHSKVFELSKDVGGNPSGLLNALKANLRTSYAIRPAMRVERSEYRESNNRISSSGKSSVGSSDIGCNIIQKADHQRQIKGEMNVNRGSRGCHKDSQKSTEGSSHPRIQVKKLGAGLKQSVERKHNVRDHGQLVQPVKRRAGVSNMSKASNKDKAPVLISHALKSKSESRSTAAASTSKRAPKLKALSRMTLKNSSNKSRVTSQSIGSENKLKKLPCGGKENMRAKTILGKKPDVKVADHEKSKQELENKVGRSTSVGLKVRAGRGKYNKQATNSHVYFR